MRTASAVERRLLRIRDEIAAIKAETLALLQDLPLDDKHWQQWTRITEHIANVESLAHNALRRAEREEAGQI